MGFYNKYIPDGEEIEALFRTHWITVIDSFILWLSFGAIIPSFLYYQSLRVQELVPFYVLEIFLCIIFFKILYELFNWYHDVWIVTPSAIYDLEWSLFRTNIESVHFESIEGVECETDSIFDKILNKGTIILHKHSDEELIVYNVSRPFESVEIMEEILTHHHHEEPEEEDRFDIIMDTLSGVVKEYLEKNGGKNEIGDDEEFSQEQDTQIHDEYTLDIRK